MGNSIRISNGKSGQTQSPGIPGGNPSGTSRWHSIHNLRCSLFGILESIPSKILGRILSGFLGYIPSRIPGSISSGISGGNPLGTLLGVIHLQSQEGAVRYKSQGTFHIESQDIFHPDFWRVFLLVPHGVFCLIFNEALHPKS